MSSYYQCLPPRPPPFNNLISDWWTAATQGDRHNFIRTLIPSYISNTVRSPVADLSYAQHRKCLFIAIKKRCQRLKTVLQGVQQWLRDILIPDLHTLQPNSADNLRKNAPSVYSTSTHIPTPLSFPKMNSPTPLNKHPNKKCTTTTRQSASRSSTLYLATPSALPAHTSQVANAWYWV